MAETHLDHPGDWKWFHGRGPAPVLGPCPHATCPHERGRAIAHGPDFEHYVLTECREPAEEGGCGGTCRGWYAEYPPGEGPFRARFPQEWLHVEALAALRGDQP